MAGNRFLYLVIDVHDNKLEAQAIAWLDMGSTDPMRFARSPVAVAMQTDDFAMTDVGSHTEFARI